MEAGAEIVELRVDRIEDAAAVEKLLAAPRQVPFILTIRSAAEGGAWDGADDERIALMERLGLLLPGFVDIELDTFERSANLRQKMALVAASLRERDCTGKLRDTVAATHRPRNELILSVHDLRGTPANLRAVFDRLLASPAAIIKAAFAAADATDGLRILVELARVALQRPAIVIGMGDGGLATRILARKFGAFLSFAALDAERESAAGQISPATMRNLYRWDSIDTATQVYGVVGWPVGHSKSPHVHNHAMAHGGVNGVYVPLPVAPGYDAFARFMRQVCESPQLDIRGLSVTIPHKENAYRWLRESNAPISPLAARCGAVNTLTLRTPDKALCRTLKQPLPDGRGSVLSGAPRTGVWNGDNTDTLAIAALLARESASATQSDARPRLLILGAGGVARAAAVAAVERGMHVIVTNRTAPRAAALAAELGCESVAWEQRGRCAANVIIQCTSVGMQPDIDATPLPDYEFHHSALVIDTIYAPPQTRLLRDAAQQACRTISGLELFALQAEAQYELWHGAPPPNGEMKRCLNAVL